MTPIEHAANEIYNEVHPFITTNAAWEESVAIITHHLTTLTKPLWEENKDLRTKLVYAEDAAAKGDLARQNAAGMEQELAAISAALDKEFGPEDKRSGDLLDDLAAFIDHHKSKEDENKRLREVLDGAIRIVKAEFGDDNWRIERIQALTKPT